MHVNVYYLAALAGVAVFVWEIMKFLSNRHEESIKDTVLRAIQELKEHTIEPLLLDVAILKDHDRITWDRGMSLARDSAVTLHHPEPSRFRVDELLDVFLAGTITKTEIAELKGYLEIIISWDESKPAPFKVFQGEQTAASILMHTIDHITPGEDA